MQEHQEPGRVMGEIRGWNKEPVGVQEIVDFRSVWTGLGDIGGTGMYRASRADQG